MKRRDFLRRSLQVVPVAALLAPLAACEKKNKPAPATREPAARPKAEPRKAAAPRKAAPADRKAPAARAKTGKVPFEWKGAPPPNNMPAVAPSNATAKALAYNPHSSKVDAAKYKKFKKGNQCDNCNFYKALNKEWGKCQLLPNGAVTNTGWCKTWVKKA